MHYTNIISKGAKDEFFKEFVSAREYNFFVTAHFPFDLLSREKHEYCISRVNAFYVRLNRRVFGEQKLRLKHFTMFEDRKRYGASCSFHLHALWHVPSSWGLRVIEYAKPEWSKTFSMDELYFRGDRIHNVDIVTPYFFKHFDSGYDFLISE